MSVSVKPRIEPHIVKTDGMAFKKEMIDLQFR